jgi:uncharacterized membrane protein
MIDTQHDSKTASDQIVLSPNMSACWQTTKYFLYIVSSFALIIAVSFAAIGAWMVLPFTGIEILVLLIVMYRVSRKCYRKEVIRLTKDSIVVEQGQNKPVTSWHSELFWTRLIIQSQSHSWHSNRLFLRGRHDQIEIGAFLSDPEKDIKKGNTDIGTC